MTDVTPDSSEPGAAVPDGDELVAAGAAAAAVDVKSLEEQITELQAKRDALAAQEAATAAAAAPPPPSIRDEILSVADVGARRVLGLIADHLGL